MSQPQRKPENHILCGPVSVVYPGVIVDKLMICVSVTSTVRVSELAGVLTLCTLLAAEGSTVTAQVESVNRTTTLIATELTVVYVDIACVSAARLAQLQRNYITESVFIVF